MWGFGMRPDDAVFIGSFFRLYLGRWGAPAGTERLGAAVFPFGAGVPGHTERAIEWLQEVYGRAGNKRISLSKNSE